MWHEARKQEKLIRSKLVDTAKRLDRRRKYYDSIREDPDQFMQIHGRKCKIHLDANTAKAASTSLRKWQGDPHILIDRFDARAHLESISDSSRKPILSTAEEVEEIQADFERYRLLIINQFQYVSESDFLHKIEAKEFWEDKRKDSGVKTDKKKKRKEAAAIGFSYGDSKVVPGSSNQESDSDDEQEFFDEYEPTVNPNDLSAERALELNKIGQNFGRLEHVFIDLLRIDYKEQTEQAQLRDLEKAKHTLSGKGAKHERNRLKSRRAMLLSQFNENEDASKTLLSILQKQKKSKDRDSSSESDDGLHKNRFVIGGNAAPTVQSSRIIPLLNQTSEEDDAEKQKLLALKNRRSNSPMFFDDDQGTEKRMIKKETSESENSKRGDSSDDEPLEIRSSMSEEEKERREIENRKRRIKRTKRIVNSRDSRKESNGEQGRKVDVAERLRAKMERKLNKRTAQLRADERSKAREREHEKREREETLMDEARILRQRERGKKKELDNISRRRSRSSSDDDNGRRRRSSSRSRSPDKRRKDSPSTLRGRSRSHSPAPSTSKKHRRHSSSSDDSKERSREPKRGRRRSRSYIRSPRRRSRGRGRSSSRSLSPDRRHKRSHDRQGHRDIASGKHRSCHSRR